MNTEEVVCPKCHSNQISANKKGFNATNALIGNLTGGAALGISMGLAGSNKIVITCLKCGNQFRAGDGTIKKVDQNGLATYEKQHYVNKSKSNARAVALALLIIMLIVMAVLYHSLFD